MKAKQKENEAEEN